MGNYRNSVDFIGIGAQKCATTWIFFNLIKHPKIRDSQLSSNKEINFFNHFYYKGTDWYDRQFHFGDWLVGESSPLYFCEPSVPVRIKQYNPEIKLLLSLRNPVDRAYSQHRHEVMRNRLGGDKIIFENALPGNPSYIEQGLYATHLSHWLEHFPKERIFISLFR